MTGRLCDVCGQPAACPYCGRHHPDTPTEKRPRTGDTAGGTDTEERTLNASNAR